MLQLTFESNVSLVVYYAQKIIDHTRLENIEYNHVTVVIY